MLCKRIIPCLDVLDGRVVKGTNFKNLKDAGSPIELAKSYEQMGADELVFLDIMATNESRSTMWEVVTLTAKEVFIPITVGGGIRTLEDIHRLLNAGADKISVNTAAIKRPKLIEEAARKYGSQCMIAAVDAKRNWEKEIWEVYINGGSINTGIDAIAWCKAAEESGAGEILLTSIDADGTKRGYDIELTARVAHEVGIPVIASGGAGKTEDFIEVFEAGRADGALAASLFHFGEIGIGDLKGCLREKGIPVRISQQGEDYDGA